MMIIPASKTVQLKSNNNKKKQEDEEDECIGVSGTEIDNDYHGTFEDIFIYFNVTGNSEEDDRADGENFDFLDFILSCLCCICL